MDIKDQYQTKMNKASNFDSSKNQEILLDFTRELIKHSSHGEVYNLMNVLQKEKRVDNNKNFTSYPIGKSLISSGKELGNFDNNFIRKEGDIRKNLFPTQKTRVIEYSNPLVIPKTFLPLRFQYLKPTSTKIDIDLRKLNPYVRDPLVGEIECSGANQKIIVSGTMGRKKTNLSLSREEIEDVINKFSEVSKIPVQEGLFKVVVGNYIFSAIVSNLITSRFVIKKINYNPNFRK